MSAFDATLRALDVQVIDPQSEDQTSTQLAVIVGLILPIAQGPGQPPIPAPLGILRFDLDKTALQELSQDAGEAAEKLKSHSSVVLANSLDGVDKAAEFQQGLRG